MRRAGLWVGLIPLLAILLVGCNRTTAGQGAAAGGPRAWIDAPLDGSSLPLGPVAVVAHGADIGGLARAEFSVDGLAFLDPDPPQDQAASLVTWHQVWEPSGPGTYQIQVRVQNHDGDWSAPAQVNVTIQSAETPTPVARPTPAASPTPTCELRAQFITDVTVPDGTMFVPGSPFTKTWRLRNVGDCTWDRGYSLVFIGGVQMSGASPQPLLQTTAPGEEVDISIGLIAPSSEGEYRGEWMLQDPQGRIFGIGADGRAAFWVEIVSGVRPTPAPDRLAPGISAAHNPPGASLPVGTQVTISASASDDVGVARIEIWISYARGGPQLVQTCSNTTSCSYQSAFPAGTVAYHARAYDEAGNMSSSNLMSIEFYYVIQ